MKYLYIALSLIETKLLRKRKPIVVSFSLTNRCNQQCLYCAVWKNTNNDLSTQDILRILDALCNCGIKTIRFTGGEPLLRDDIGEIIVYAKKKKFSIWINTNGTLVFKKISQLRSIDGLQISLDGPKEIHDYIRGSGAYEKVIEALETTKNNSIKVKLITVLNKYNLSFIDYILEIALQFKTVACFQPVTPTLLDGYESNPALPKESAYQQCISKLIMLKKQGNKQIYNSFAGLRYLYRWPNTPKINCSAGRLFFRIESSGEVWPCRNKNFSTGFGNLRTPYNSMKKIINNLPLPGSKCECCGCASVIELNYAFALKLEPLVNLIKIEFR
jgi:MoaA/NifB/PqqE/SkfB family radical SAM enzyme